VLGFREWARRGLVANRQPFQALERLGLHVMPVHWATPIPDTRELRARLDRWYRPSSLGGVDVDLPRQLELLAELGRVEPLPLRYEELSAAGFGEGYEAIDAEILWRMIRHVGPSLVVEVGAGLSTAVTSAALGGTGKVVAIEPYPRPALERLAGVDLVRERAQDVGPEIFDRLGAGDVLFIDSSHYVSLGSDVPWLFLEVVPRLASGVLVHVHDIHLPYPIRDPHYVFARHAFWNEVFLVQAFLQFNREFEILLAAAMVRHLAPDALGSALPQFDGRLHAPSSLWLRRR